MSMLLLNITKIITNKNQNYFKKLFVSIDFFIYLCIINLKRFRYEL